MGNEVARVGASAGKTLDAIGPDVKRFTAETLPELEQLLGEMGVLAASLRRLSEKIEGSPGGLLLGRRPVPPGRAKSRPKERQMKSTTPRRACRTVAARRRRCSSLQWR